MLIRLRQLKKLSPETGLVLTSDFNGAYESIKTVVNSPIKVFAQNIETVERLTYQ